MANTDTKLHSSLTAHGPEDLEGHVSDLLHAEGQEVVPSEDLEGAEAEQLEHDADVTVVLEPVQHPHACTEQGRVSDRIYPTQTPNPLGFTPGATHNLLSSSRLLISSSTATSDLATSRKHSMFLTIFTATRCPLWNEDGEFSCCQLAW